MSFTCISMPDGSHATYESPELAERSLREMGLWGKGPCPGGLWPGFPARNPSLGGLGSADWGGTVVYLGIAALALFFLVQWASARRAERVPKWNRRRRRNAGSLYIDRLRDMVPMAAGRVDGLHFAWTGTGGRGTWRWWEGDPDDPGAKTIPTGRVPQRTRTRALLMVRKARR